MYIKYKLIIENNAGYVPDIDGIDGGYFPIDDWLYGIVPKGTKLPAGITEVTIAEWNKLSRNSQRDDCLNHLIGAKNVLSVCTMDIDAILTKSYMVKE